MKSDVVNFLLVNFRIEYQGKKLPTKPNNANGKTSIK